MPSDVSFRDIRSLLERHGWSLDRIKGSHHVFAGEGRRTVVIPVHKGKVKFCYKREIDRQIAALGLGDEEGRRSGAAD
ncbi:MAG TPA: type II toxin-antitoxin system HicA family toxin [Phycisphaerales bacterium]|nr:type II toxin-antitoxin system HicA family toxin [Phycisphaerales bacterium]